MTTSAPSDYQSTAAKALALCAANDPWFPKPNRGTVAAWAEQIAIYQLDEGDVLDGVRLAYRDNGSGFKPLPRDIVQRAVHIRRERADRETTAERQSREDQRDAALAARRLSAITASAGPFGKSP